MQTGINIADYLAKLEKSIRQGRFSSEVMALAKELATELKRETCRSEAVATVNGQAPLLENNSKECLMWASSILVSAWSTWVFTAKSNDPVYSTQHEEAAVNARIVRPYVRRTILNAIEAGAEIGSSSRSNYRPEGIEKFIRVEKSG